MRRIISSFLVIVTVKYFLFRTINLSKSRQITGKRQVQLCLHKAYWRQRFMILEKKKNLPPAKKFRTISFRIIEHSRYMESVKSEIR